MKRKQKLYSATTILASVVLYYVLDLSKSGRNTIDWIVITLVVGALAWNLTQLGRRLARGGTKEIWHLLGTISFWIVGLFNTVLLQPEDVGEWKHWVGRAFIVLAIFDSIAIAMKERRLMQEPEGGAEQPPELSEPGE